MQFQAYYHTDAAVNRNGMYLPGMGGGTGRINPSPSILKPADKRSWTSSETVDKSSTYPVKPAAPLKSALHKPSVVVEKPVVVKTHVRLPPSPEITYQVFPGGPRKTFLRPESTSETNAAATHIQRVVRGHCMRTKFYILKLEHKLATIQEDTAEELEQIEYETKEAKMNLRRQATKTETATLKKSMVCSETATQGTQIIQFLRGENKKLRKKNNKLAKSIAELKVENDSLEQAIAITKENEKLLQTHFDKIKETNDALNNVIPKYEARLAEMKDECEIRRQYCLAEHKMKIMYVKLNGTLCDMVEHHSNDDALAEEVVALALENECPEEAAASSEAMLKDCQMDEEDEYDEVSVASDDSEYEEVEVEDDE